MKRGTRHLKVGHTHRDAKNAYDDLNNGNSNHRMLDTALDEPVVGIESKDETKDVFEDDHQGEAFNREISYNECKRLQRNLGTTMYVTSSQRNSILL